MSNLNGWGLTARLISKHFGVLGDKISEAIANFDPETATEADRDRLAETFARYRQRCACQRLRWTLSPHDASKHSALLNGL